MQEQIFYHILIDSDLSSINELYSIPFKTNFLVFGNLRDNISKSMPVTFEIDDAKTIALRMIDVIKESGSCLSNKKCYPVFGAIIVKMSILLENDKIVNIENIQHKQDGTRNYSILENKGKLTTYYALDKNSKNVKRGVLCKSLFSDVKLTSAQYIYAKNPNELGWAILNSFKNLSGNDIRCLKYIYDSKKEVDIDHTSDGIKILDKDFLQKQNNISPIVYMSGGSSVIQNTIQNIPSQSGGAEKPLEEMTVKELRQKLKKMKAEYSIKKTVNVQSGGHPDENSLNQLDEKELRRKIKQVKNKYLTAKSNKL